MTERVWTSVGCECDKAKGYERELCDECGHYRDCIDHADFCEWMVP